ncbi:MAG: Ig-like domain-containing protein [Kofleriaceae bacterium]|nr:Ig-like domain-containing protein [Kofleriaceae bacterium]
MKKLLCLLPLMACGDDGATPADAAIDSQVADDAPPIDAPPTSGTVTVTIRDNGAAVEGVNVYFQNPDGSLAAKVATNASGVASATMMTGGWVTAVDARAPSLPSFGGRPIDHELKTWAGVEPGDQLLIEDGGGSVSSITATVTLPTNNNLSYAELHTTCGEDVVIPGQSDSITLWDCNGAADIIVIGFDDESLPIGYFYKANVTVADAGTLDFAAETYAALPDATFSFSNFPAEFSGLELENQIVTPHGNIYEVGDSTALASGAASVMVERPLPTPSKSILTSFLATGSSTHALFSWQATAATHAFDATGKILPSFSSTPTYDAATRRVSWESTGTIMPDMAMYEMYVGRDGGGWTWEILAPYTGTSVTMPDLPTEIAEYLPLATDTVVTDELGAARLPGGYDAIRPIFYASSDGPPTSGSSGDISVVFFQDLRVARTPAPTLFSNTAKDKLRAAQKAAMKAKLAKVRAAKTNKMAKRAR